MKDLEKEKLDRREFLKRGSIAAVGLGLMACAPAAAPTPTPTKAAAAPTPAVQAPAATPTPSEAETIAKIYEAAKKEGELMAYSCGTQQEWEEAAAEFTKQYPGIKAAAFVGTGEAVRDKLLTEARARKMVGDVLLRPPGDYVYTFTQEGLLEPYLSPQVKYYDANHYDPKGLWYTNMWNPFAPEYNTKAITKEQAPKSYQDLLKPEFKGMLGLEASAFYWFTGMLSIMGKEKGLDYMRKLAEQKPRLISGHTSLHKLVVSGEIPIAVYMYGLRVLPDKEQGAPIEWVNLAETTPAMSDWLGLVKNAPHPNAAKLMLEFTLSEAGAKIMAKQMWIPTRKGMDLSKLATLAQMKVFIPSDPLWGKEVNENEKVFRDIFGKP